MAGRAQAQVPHTADYWKENRRERNSWAGGRSDWARRQTKKWNSPLYQSLCSLSFPSLIRVKRWLCVPVIWTARASKAWSASSCMILVGRTRSCARPLREGIARRFFHGGSLMCREISVRRCTVRATDWPGWNRILWRWVRRRGVMHSPPFHRCYLSC